MQDAAKNNPAQSQGQKECDEKCMSIKDIITLIPEE